LADRRRPITDRRNRDDDRPPTAQEGRSPTADEPRLEDDSGGGQWLAVSGQLCR